MLLRDTMSFDDYFNKDLPYSHLNSPEMNYLYELQQSQVSFISPIPPTISLSKEQQEGTMAQYLSRVAQQKDVQLSSDISLDTKVQDAHPKRKFLPSLTGLGFF